MRRKTAELFDKRYHNGMETRSALHIAQSRLAAAQGELQVLDERIQLTRYQLAELLGAGPDRGLPSSGRKLIRTTCADCRNSSLSTCWVVARISSPPA